MTPSAQIDGRINGFKSGFKFKENDWQKDFQKSEWNKYKDEIEFKNSYLKEYENGIIQRKRIQKEFQIKLGLITSQEKKIQDEYLNQVFDIFYGTSYLFKSWEERINKEIFPQNTNYKSTEELRNKTVHLIKTKKYQKSLQHLKELFLKERTSKSYHKVLQIDFRLQRLRVKSKLKQIDQNEYKNGLLEIENQLSLVKKEIENKT